MNQPNQEKVVLLVEDEVDQAEIYIQILNKIGFIVFWVSSVDQTSKALAAHSRVIDSIVCDNNLGSVEVGGLVRELAQTFKIPCFVMSGWVSEGVDFAKPLDWQRVQTVLMNNAA